MPDKPITVATYAAGASLAAITLVYVFGPTFFLDEGQQSSSARKTNVVGLSNPANDCFMNSILQALAGLGDLRLYLIRETHRRELDGSEVYRIQKKEGENGSVQRSKSSEREDGRDRHTRREEKGLEGMQRGIVTRALKELLDQLNERPIYKKTISAHRFIVALERALASRISRQQQDAQEFLQVVTERLKEEYYAGRRARRRAARRNERMRSRSVPRRLAPSVEEQHKSEVTNLPGRPIRRVTFDHTADAETHSQSAKVGRSWVEDDDNDESSESSSDEDDSDEEEEFPFEGKLESEISCMHCGFKPKPSSSNFMTMTLHVPQTTSTSLSSCFDEVFRVENIDDFRCDLCRLEHALTVKHHELARTTDVQKRRVISSQIVAIQQAIATDPEKPPSRILPPLSEAPKRRISRHTRISRFPRLLAVHLSRSMYSQVSLSTKNLAKVSFPERLPLGGLLPASRRSYRLRALVTHKGGHNSGHYESFRRQRGDVGGPNGAIGPYSTPANFGKEGAYSARNNVQGLSPKEPTPPPTKSALADSAISAASAAQYGDMPMSAMPRQLRDLHTDSAHPLAPSPRFSTSSRSSSPSTQNSSGPADSKHPPPPPRSHPMPIRTGSTATNPRPLSTALSTTTATSELYHESESDENGEEVTALPDVSSQRTHPLSPLSSSPGGTTAASSSSLKRSLDDSSSIAAARRFSRRSLNVAAGALANVTTLGMSSTGIGSDGRPLTSANSRPATSTRRRKECDRWWRISDDKVKEARTAEVLAMQREVYLLFYELEE